MSLTPEDILGKRFHDAFRGYNHEEVDVFLDEVAAAFEAAFKELQAARARAEELEGQLEEIRSTEGMLKRTLLAAQRAADEVVAEATTEAARLIAAGEDEAAASVAGALQQAEDIIAGATSRQSQIEDLGSRLHDMHAAYLSTLRAHLEDQLRALDDLPAPLDPAPPPGAAPVLAADAEDAADAAPLTVPDPEAGPEPAPEGPAALAPANDADTPPAPTLLASPQSPPGESPESSTAAPKPASSFPALRSGAEVEPGPAARGTPPSRRVAGEPPRQEGPTGGSQGNGESSAREPFWGRG